MVARAEDERRQAIDAALDAALTHGSFVHPRLAAALRYAVFPGGQRWRPMLTLAAAELCGARWDGALKAAVAVELLHSSSLIFDDLPCMDDSHVRRDRPSVHAQFGEGIAVLAAIGLLTCAYQQLALSPRPRTAVRLASRYLGPTEILTGQAFDLETYAGRPAAGVRRRLHDRKTTALVKLGLLEGALHGCSTVAQRRALSRFGDELGAAYQRLDDVADAGQEPVLLAQSEGVHAAVAQLERAEAGLSLAFGDHPSLPGLTRFGALLRARARVGGAVTAAG